LKVLAVYLLYQGKESVHFSVIATLLKNYSVKAQYRKIIYDQSINNAGFVIRDNTTEYSIFIESSGEMDKYGDYILKIPTHLQSKIFYIFSL